MPRQEITRNQQLMPTDDLLDLIYRHLNAADTRAAMYPDKQAPGFTDLYQAVKLLADLVDRELRVAGRASGPSFGASSEEVVA